MTEIADQAVIRAALVLSGGMFERDTVAAITDALLATADATGRLDHEQSEAHVRAIAQIAFTTTFEHCQRYRGSIDLPLTGAPYAAMLLLAGSLVVENEQMREAARRNTLLALEREQDLMRQASEARLVAEGYNSLQNTKATESPQTIAHMAWIDLQHRDDIGGEHTSGFCRSCADNHRIAQRLFSSVPDTVHDS